VTIASFEGKPPNIGESTYVHPSADVLGDVVISKRCWIDFKKTYVDLARRCSTGWVSEDNQC